MASLVDLAMLSGMYQMFAGFFHGAAMVGSEGMTAATFAARATPFISAMTGSFARHAQVIDGGEQSSSTMMGATADHIHAASATQRIRAALR